MTVAQRHDLLSSYKRPAPCSLVRPGLRDTALGRPTSRARRGILKNQADIARQCQWQALQAAMNRRRKHIAARWVKALGLSKRCRLDSSVARARPRGDETAHRP